MHVTAYYNLSPFVMDNLSYERPKIVIYNASSIFANCYIVLHSDSLIYS